MRGIVTAKRFERDLKRAKKRGKDLDKLFALIDKLCVDEEIEVRHCPHAPTGNWKPFWDLHIEPDWLLIYEITEDEVYLYRTGTHADLFG